MTADQLNNLAAVISGGIGVTANVIMGVKVLIGALSPGVTEQELDAQVDAIVADASRRMAERRTMIGG